MAYHISPFFCFFFFMLQIVEDTGMILIAIMFVIFITGHHITIT